MATKTRTKQARISPQVDVPALVPALLRLAAAVREVIASALALVLVIKAPGTTPLSRAQMATVTKAFRK